MDDPLIHVPFEGQQLVWRSESQAPPPRKLSRVDDRLTANAAIARVRRGEHLLYEGDWRNARQLLTAMGRRANRRREGKPLSPLETFRAERLARLREHETLSRVLVRLDEKYRLVALKHAPEVAEICEDVWGEATGPTLVPLKALVGMIGAGEWKKRGLAVRGLKGKLHPAYGVFLPTRTEYVDLLLRAPAPTGKRVFDIGTGSGVLSFLLLERGAASAVGTDLDPRSVACANENAVRLGFKGRFEALERDMYPDGRAELVVANPPWIPEPWKNRLDRAVYDEGHAFLLAFLAGLQSHLERGGEGWLLMSNLAELIGLRPEGFLEEQFAAAGLRVNWTLKTQAHHKKASDEEEPLHAARAKEVTTLYCLVPAEKAG